jgi:hypothetical protein
MSAIEEIGAYGGYCSANTETRSKKSEPFFYLDYHIEDHNELPIDYQEYGNQNFHTTIIKNDKLYTDMS